MHSGKYCNRERERDSSHASLKDFKYLFLPDSVVVRYAENVVVMHLLFPESIAPVIVAVETPELRLAITSAYILTTPSL